MFGWQFIEFSFRFNRFCSRLSFDDLKILRDLGRHDAGSIFCRLPQSNGEFAIVVIFFFVKDDSLYFIFCFSGIVVYLLIQVCAHRIF